MTYTFLSNLKNRLVLLLGAILGVLLLYISALKRAALQKDLDQIKAASKARDRYTDAFIKGIEDENKPIKRGYFDGSGK